VTDFQIRDKVTLLRDFLNNVGATATGVEVKVTQDTDLGLRFFVDPEVLVECKNSSGGTLTKGEAVYVSGDHASGKPEVTKARSDASGTMPSIGLVYETMADGDEGHIVAEGVLFQYDTDTPGWDAGTALYVDPATAGALTSTKPAGSTNKVQKVGLVTRRHATVGSIMVIGAGRSNDINNELVALMGVDARTQTDLGTFTGSIIANNRDVKEAFQDLETNAGGIRLRCPFHADGAQSCQLGAHPSTDEFLKNLNINMQLADLSTMTQVRIFFRVYTNSASANNPRLIVRYSTSYTTTLGNFSDIGTSEVSASMASYTLANSGWVDLAEAAKIDDCYITVVQTGGDRSATPRVHSLFVEFR
jgi:predicted RecA/RadA family phage recombinase